MKGFLLLQKFLVDTSGNTQNIKFFKNEEISQDHLYIVNRN